MRIPTVAERQAAVRPRRYDPPHVAWYFGGILAALAALGTVDEVSPSGRGIWQLLVALVFLVGFAALAAYLLANGWWVPAGVLATAAVVVFPAAGRAFERLIGVWPDDEEEPIGAGIVPGVDVDTSPVQEFQLPVFVLAVLTILVGLAAFSIVRFPFAFATVTVATLVALQLLLPLLVEDPRADDRMTTLILSGGIVLLVGIVLDSVERRDDAFWWHVVGLLAIAIGLVWYTAPRGKEWAWIAILLIGVSLLALSGPFARATWATFGVLGVFAAATHYLGKWLGSWHEPAVLVLVALAIVAAGIALQLYERLWERLTRREPAAAAPPPASAEPEPTPEPEPPAEEPPTEEPPPAEPERPA